MEATAQVLERQELLIWHSLDRNESLPQTRLHYERILYGISDGAGGSGGSGSGSGAGAGAGSGKARAGAHNGIVWPPHHSMGAGGEALVRAGAEFGPRRWNRDGGGDAVSGGGGGGGGGSSDGRALAVESGERAASRSDTPRRRKSAGRRVSETPERRSPRVSGGVRKRKSGGGT